MCGLCGFVYKDAARTGAVGRTLHGMLLPMGRRGTDSTGIALYGAPEDGSYVMRARIDANSGTPERVLETLERAGGVREHTMDGPNLRARLAYDGDLGDLTDQVEAEPHVEVFSIGRSMEIVKEVGDAHDVERSSPFSSFEGSHAIGHTRMATESVVDVAHSHPFWARPFPDISVVHNGHITNYHKLRRKLENQGHRFATGNDSEAIAVYIADKLAARREPGGRPARLGRRTSTARSLPDLDRRRHRRRPRPVRAEAAALRRERRDRLIASEEVAIRSVDGDTALEPRELAAGEVRWWLR